MIGVHTNAIPTQYVPHQHNTTPTQYHTKKTPYRFFRELRGVPIEAQLRSHQLFSENWAYYTTLVDAATLYHTGMVIA